MTACVILVTPRTGEVPLATMRRPFLCGRPFVSSRWEAHYTSPISMRGNASSAASMDSWRASSIRLMARAPGTPSSLSCSMPDSWTRVRSPTRQLFWAESLTTKAFGLRPSLQRQHRVERPTKGLKSSSGLGNCNVAAVATEEVEAKESVLVECGLEALGLTHFVWGARPSSRNSRRSCPIARRCDNAI
jgi:hypothetical protein